MSVLKNGLGIVMFFLLDARAFFFHGDAVDCPLTMGRRMESAGGFFIFAVC